MWKRLLALVAVNCALVVLGCSVTFAASTRPDASTQSHYERPSDESGPYKDRVIVFVHGLFGDADSTWRYSTTIYWPKLLLGDVAFQDSDIYVAAYSSPYFGNTMDLDEIATDLNTRLIADNVFSKHREVIFVCHSLGGLVVQRLLLKFREHNQQVPFIYFFATPETGVEIAKLASLFSSDPLLGVLLPGDANEYLQSMETDWKAAAFHTRRLCAYEKKKYKGVLIVDRLSGTRNCDTVPIPINEDHVGIVKPSSIKHPSYIALRNAIIATPISPKPRKPIVNAPHPDDVSRINDKEFTMLMTGWGMEAPATATVTIDTEKLLPFQSKYVMIIVVRARDTRVDWTTDPFIEKSPPFNITGERQLQVKFPVNQPLLLHAEQTIGVDLTFEFYLCLIPRALEASQIHVLKEINDKGGHVFLSSRASGTTIGKSEIRRPRLHIDRMTYLALDQERGLPISFSTTNLGGSAASGLKHSADFVITPEALSQAEVERHFAEMRALPDMQVPGTKTIQLAAGEQTSFTEYVPLIKSDQQVAELQLGKKILYMMVLLRYVDDAGALESTLCAYVNGDSLPPHLCPSDNYDAFAVSLR
jgi:pimeloyl-ACP methyl ester carboxylesterase